jgi:ADP-heptose:LPS heptosyltransferase
MGDPQNILLLHPGGVGDLVLAADLVASLRRGFPDATVELACREPVLGVAALMPVPPHSTIPLQLNPYAHEAPSPELLAEAEALARTLAPRNPSIVVAAAFKPTWLEWFLASYLRPSRSIGAVAPQPPRGLLTALLEHFELDPPLFETLDAASFPHETARYAVLARRAGVEPVTSPPWTLPPEARQSAAEYLRHLDLEPGRYLACFPFGAVPVKCWPAERFREALHTACAEFHLPALLLGSPAEQAGIDGLQASLPCARKFIGGPGDFPLLAGLLEASRAWVGNDTGPMHLAQAYRKPGVAIFGGGADRAYGPWAPGAIGLIHPLPCFGCLWDCAFSRGICVESIPAAAVMDSLRDALERPPAEPEMRSLDLVPQNVLTVIAGAAERHREAQASRKHRFELLVELEQQATRRLEALHAASRRADELAATADERGRALHQNHQAAADRARALHESELELQEIRKVALHREQVILELDAAVRQRDAALQQQQEALAAALQQHEAALAAARLETERLAALLNLPLLPSLLRLLKRVFGSAP